MAGFYSDVPAHRFALDLDGTIFKRLDAGKTTLSDAQTSSTIISDTDSDTYQLDPVIGSYPGTATRGYYVLVFPELRNIDAYFVSVTGNYAQGKELEYSSDTTDGLDGTWTVANTNWSYSGGVSPHYRLNIVSQPMLNVKALRFGYGSSSNGYSINYSFNLACLHLYGSIVGGQNPDRLRYWHPTLDQEAGPAHFDFGDVPQGTQKVIQFRIRNNSSSLTANTIGLTRDSPSYSDVTTGLSFSSDNVTYTTTLAVGTLAPGGTSAVLYVKRTVGAAETASVPKDGRITATATSWS